MAPVEIIEKYYQGGTKLYDILLEHSFSVADKALSIAQLHPELNFDIAFIYEAAMLHDIGVILTEAEDIHCYGKYPYICHGFLGGEILREEGFPRHALVCERHTGTGLSLETVIKLNIPVPQRDMQPETIEEQLICFSDKFFSKQNPLKEKSVDKIRKSLSKYGEDSVRKFNNWCDMFL